MPFDVEALSSWGSNASLIETTWKDWSMLHMNSRLAFSEKNHIITSTLQCSLFLTLTRLTAMRKIYICVFINKILNSQGYFATVVRKNIYTRHNFHYFVYSRFCTVQVLTQNHIDLHMINCFEKWTWKFIISVYESPNSHKHCPSVNSRARGRQDCLTQ